MRININLELTDNDVEKVIKLADLFEKEEKEKETFLRNPSEKFIKINIKEIKESLIECRADIEKLITNKNEVKILQQIFQDLQLGMSFDTEAVEYRKNLYSKSKNTEELINIVRGKKIERAILEFRQLAKIERTTENFMVAIYFLLDFQKYLPPQLELKFNDWEKLDFA